MPAAVQSKVRLSFRCPSMPSIGHDQLIFVPRDLLRRHSLLHEPSHTRIVVSCDACRANKTKCSGGVQCMLCARRGINCTFRSGLRRSKRPSTSDGSTAVNTSIREDDNNDDDESMLPTNSGSENSLAGNSLRTERELLPDHELFLNLSIVPSKPAPTNEFQPLGPGMEAIYELLLAEKSSLEGATQESDELQEWAAKCLETYFKSFHVRWPILNAPTFDVITEPLPLAASVCVIGAWLQDGTKQTERLCALRVHEILLQRLLHNLVCILYSFWEIVH